MKRSRSPFPRSQRVICHCLYLYLRSIDLIVNSLHEHSIVQTSCPWVSEDDFDPARHRAFSSSMVRASELEREGSWVRFPPGARTFLSFLVLEFSFFQTLLIGQPVIKRSVSHSPRANAFNTGLTVQNNLPTAYPKPLEEASSQLLFSSVQRMNLYEHSGNGREICRN